jgi:hypothetical protein
MPEVVPAAPNLPWTAEFVPRPLFHRDFSSATGTSYVVSQKLRPRERLAPAESSNPVEVAEELARRAAALGADHCGQQLIGDSGGHASILGPDFSVRAFAMDAHHRFAVFCGQITDQSIGMSPAADLTTANMLAGSSRWRCSEVDRTGRWEQALWLWTSDGVIVPMQRLGRVAGVDIAQSGTWAAVVEDFPGTSGTHLTAIDLPSGNRKWSIRYPAEPPHLRISPDERWIAFAGPGVVEVASGRIFAAPGSVTALNDRPDQDFLAFPMWAPGDASTLSCVGFDVRGNQSPSVLYNLDLRSGLRSEVRPIQGLPGREAFVTDADLDPSGRYLLTVDASGVPEHLGEDDGPGALCCIDVANASFVWASDICGTDFITVNSVPRWTGRRTFDQASEVNLKNWPTESPQVNTSFADEQIHTAQDRAFDTEFLMSAAQCANRILDIDDAVVAERLAYILIRDLQSAIRLGQRPGIDSEIVQVFRTAIERRPNHPTTAVIRTAADRIDNIGDLPEDAQYWQRQAVHR